MENFSVGNDHGWDQNSWNPTGMATGGKKAMILFLPRATTGRVLLLGVNHEFLPQRQLWPASLPQSYLSQVVPVRTERSARENLARIREVFSPSISALAKSLDVTRQTIYNWQNGEATSEFHAAKLDDLAKAADMLAAVSADPNRTVLQREFAGGKNLLQLVQEGGSAQEAIALLIPVLQQGERQRKELDIIFANRKLSAPSADFDLIAPNDLD